MSEHAGDRPELLDELAGVLRGPHGSIRIVATFTHGLCVQVYEKTRKVGPIIIPDRKNGQTLGDVLAMLGNVVDGGEPRLEVSAEAVERVRTMDATQPGIYGRAVMDTLVHLGLAERPI